MILAKTSIAFKLTRVNSRFDVSRARIIRENTHITKINKNLIRVNAISQTFINFFLINVFQITRGKKIEEKMIIIKIIINLINQAFFYNKCEYL